MHGAASAGATPCTLFLVVALIGGWSWFWHFRRRQGASRPSKAGARARPRPGRIYTCGSQTIGGFPFRFEVNCDKASALFRSKPAAAAN